MYDNIADVFLRRDFNLYYFLRNSINSGLPVINLRFTLCKLTLPRKW